LQKNFLWSLLGNQPLIHIAIMASDLFIKDITPCHYIPACEACTQVILSTPSVVFKTHHTIWHAIHISISLSTQGTYRERDNGATTKSVPMRVITASMYFW